MKRNQFRLDCRRLLACTGAGVTINKSIRRNQFDSPKFIGESLLHLFRIKRKVELNEELLFPVILPQGGVTEN